MTLSDHGGLTVHTRLQSMFNDRPNDPIDRVVHEIIMTHAVMAEKMGPGGFDACVKLVLQDLRLILAGGRPPARNDVLTRLEIVGGRPPTIIDLERLIDACVIDAPTRIQAMVRRAIELAGYGGRIIVERSASIDASIELVCGYTFDIEPVWKLSTVLHEPRIAVIDGYIETVAEVNAFLEAAHAAREPVCLFVRGLAPEVTTTLRTNYDRGTLQVVPVIVRFDAEGINVLKDIATVAGCDIVSSAKGDLISMIKFSSCPRIESCSLGPGRTVLVNSRTNFNVDTLVTSLRTRRVSEAEQLGVLLDARIRSLSPNHVVVRLPEDRDFVRSAHAFDGALRAVGAAVDRGVVDVTGVDAVAPGSPVGTLAGAIMHSQLCVDAITTIGAVITS